jgi:hypothetical protein
MKRSSYLVAGMILGALAMSAADSMTTQDPVKISPQYYSVLLENDRVRVLEYHLKPGEKEGMHTHPPGLVYSFSDAKLRVTPPEGKSSDVAAERGHVSWRDSTTHSLENIGTTEAHALAIEMKPCKP